MKPVRPLWLLVITADLLTGCGIIHSSRIAVPEAVQQSSEIIPVRAHIKLSGRSYEFGDYRSNESWGWSTTDSWRIFGIGKDTFKHPFILSVLGKDGKE